MKGCIHVGLPRILDVFDEFRIRPCEIGTCHIHEVSETAHDATISTNSNVPIDVIIFTFYSDQLRIDVETGIVTK
jgi:hypothetical protein